MVFNSTVNRDGFVIPGEYNNTGEDQIGLMTLDQTALTRWVRTMQAAATDTDLSQRFYTENDLRYSIREQVIAADGSPDSPVGVGLGVPSKRIALISGETLTSDVNGAVGQRGSVTTWAGIGANPRSGIGGVRQASGAVQSAVVNAGLANGLTVCALFKINPNDTTVPFSIIARSAADDTEHIRLQFVQTTALTLVRRTGSADTNEQSAFTVAAPGLYAALGMRLSGTNVSCFFNGVKVFSGALSGTAQAFTGTRAGISFRSATVGNGGCLLCAIRSL